MEKIDSTILKKIKKLSLSSNVNNKDIHINGNNVNKNINKKKFAFNPNHFKLNTPESQLAHDIAVYFNDLENFAFHLSVVKSLGLHRTVRLFRTIKEDIKQKTGTRFEVRFPHKYYAWSYRNFHKLGI